MGITHAYDLFWKSRSTKGQSDSAATPEANLDADAKMLVTDITHAYDLFWKSRSTKEQSDSAATPESARNLSGECPDTWLCNGGYCGGNCSGCPDCKCSELCALAPAWRGCWVRGCPCCRQLSEEQIPLVI